MADARKTLRVLHDEWVTCQKCELGLRRLANASEFVFGSGAVRGIMCIGEGPGWKEEKEGEPFTDKSGEVLRGVLYRLGAQEVYFTHCVSCRSCTPVMDANGVPMLKSFWKGAPPRPVFKDEPPLPVHIQQCLPRLHEEIYLVDPVVIVACGAKAAEALMGRSISITQDRGKERHIEIPGATNRAVLTDKLQAWARRLKGKLVMPVEVNQVRYLMIPTYHPSYVLRKVNDQGHNNPFQLFAEDIRLAVKIYERYALETRGILPNGASDATNEELTKANKEEEDG